MIYGHNRGLGDLQSSIKLLEPECSPCCPVAVGSKRYWEIYNDQNQFPKILLSNHIPDFDMFTSWFSKAYPNKPVLLWTSGFLSHHPRTCWRRGLVIGVLCFWALTNWLKHFLPLTHISPFNAAIKTTPPSLKRKKQKPYTPDFILAIHTKLDLSLPVHAATYACLTMTFHAVACLGEFTVKNLTVFNPNTHIKHFNVWIETDCKSSGKYLFS